MLARLRGLAAFFGRGTEFVVLVGERQHRYFSKLLQKIQPVYEGDGIHKLALN